MSGQKTTIKDVARVAGVSITTVSQILNGKSDRFSKDTIEKVKKAKSDLGYEPNFFAQSMILKQTNTIGVLVPDISNPFFNSMMHGIEEALYEQNFMAILCSADGDQLREFRYLEELSRRSVDGFIIASSAVSNDAISKSLIAKKKPFILLDQKTGNNVSDGIQIDDFEGGKLAAIHLLSLGHRKIVIVLPSLEQRPKNIHNRLAGFTEEVTKYENTKLILIETPMNPMGGYQIVDEVINSTATAIFAINDELAIGLYRGLFEAGKSIPNDYSVVGFDNIEMTEFLSPKLTTVSQPIQKIGKVAAQIVMARVANSDLPIRHEKLNVELMIRESTKKI
ncbi:ribose utilization transcriptional repressor RbsR [Dellaglioa sp. L3N]